MAAPSHHRLLFPPQVAPPFPLQIELWRNGPHRPGAQKWSNFRCIFGPGLSSIRAVLYLHNENTVSYNTRVQLGHRERLQESQ